jgi:hypothetical protein
VERVLIMGVNTSPHRHRVVSRVMMRTAVG